MNDINFTLNEKLNTFYKYCEVDLPQKLSALPLGAEQKVGIYGKGRHTEKLLSFYKNIIGDIVAEIFFIDSVAVTQYNSKECTVNVNDLDGIQWDWIIISSYIYQEEMYRTVCKAIHTSRINRVIRIYNEGDKELFMSNMFDIIPKRPFSEMKKVTFFQLDKTEREENNPLMPVMDSYKIEVREEKPDVLIYSLYGDKHKSKNDAKIKVAYWPGEAITPEFTQCDYSITPLFLSDSKNCRWNIYESIPVNIQNREEYKKEKLFYRKFCNFIYSNGNDGEGAIIRQLFCRKLMMYKNVDCPGKIMNNTKDQIADRYSGDWEKSKLNYIKGYKFTISFENRKADGYTTEKLFDPLKVGSIPIYWGNPKVNQIVNNECFVNCNDFDNDFDAVINKIIEIDNDKELYMHMVQCSPMRSDFRFDNEIRLKEIWERIVNNF